MLKSRCRPDRAARVLLAPLVVVALAIGHAVLFAGVSGCASASDAVRRARVASEPGAVVLRNASGRSYDFLVVREASLSASGAHRLGSIQPVLPGVEAVFQRRENPAPFPAEVVVVWGIDGRAPRSVLVSLRSVLDRATGPTERLVFELTETESVRVLIEFAPPVARR